MARFRKSPLSPQKSESVAQKQAVKVMARMQGRDNPIKSIGTARGYTNCLKKVARYVNQQFNISLRELTPEQAKQYLDVRSEEVGQKNTGSGASSYPGNDAQCNQSTGYFR